MLVCFTASYRTADFALLERLERHAEPIGSALRAHPSVHGCVLLSTCNRFEAYLDTRPGEGIPALVLDEVAAASGIAPDTLRDGSELVADHRVAEHLFSVSSGLDSVVVGEGEIAGQVRRAFASAREEASVTRELDALFRNAARTSRAVKSTTELAQAGRSVVRLALELAASRVADWSAIRVLLVGTGRYAAATLAALRERGVTDVEVYSRTGRGASFARSHGIAHVPATGLVDAVARADLVVACTIAPTVILDARLVALAASRDEGGLPAAPPAAGEPRGCPGAAERAEGQAGSRHRLLIDLGLPRNIAPEVAQVPGTVLLDLETISLHATVPELQATERARRLVGDAAAAFAAQRAEREVEPALVALRSHVFDALETELARVRRRLDPEAADTAEAALRHLVGVLLHTPSTRAHELARDGNGRAFVAGIDAVFGLDTARADAQPDAPGQPDSADVAS